MQQLGAEAFKERYGHEWNVPERVREYVERVDRDIDQRAEGFAVLAALIPFPREAQISVLDVGSGQGLVASRLLDAFPASHAIGLDVSEQMGEVARDRMAHYGDRFSFVLGDFLEGGLPEQMTGSFDVVVSSRALHHVPVHQKRVLYGTIYTALRPGGCFFNLDGVSPPDERLRPLYRQATARMRGTDVAPVRDETRSTRGPSAGHHFQSLEQELHLFREAGFERVDCVWKRLAQALIGGYKP
jgi:ubiquinone/menaquinone biosynthesis C-methylase UbiE